MTIRYIAFLFVSAASDIPDERLKVHPDVEVYRISRPNPEDQIDMGLLNDLVRPVEMAFVGGEDASSSPRCIGEPGSKTARPL